MLFSAHPASKPTHGRYHHSQLSPGDLTAHKWSRLVLLCSQPDTVHGDLLRKTQTSTPLMMGSPAGSIPQTGYHPCYSGFQVQGAATSPAARTFIILYRTYFCQSRESRQKWLSALSDFVASLPSCMENSPVLQCLNNLLEKPLKGVHLLWKRT